MLRATCLVAAALLVACGGSDDGECDDTSRCALDGGPGGEDAGPGLDAATGEDAGPGRDAGGTTDAGTSPDGGACTECLEAPLEWGHTGGFTAWERTSRIDPCNAYTLTEEDRSDPPVSTTCSNAVPCAGTDAITMADVLEALGHEDVVAAFAAAPITYGRDLRPVDGSIFEVTQSGKTFLVGADCPGGGGACVPVPAGVRSLVTLLDALQTERLAEEDCSTVFAE